MVDSERLRKGAVWLSVAMDHNSARCRYCGKRMKFATGGLIGFAGREHFCRACGREQPTFAELLGDAYGPEDSNGIDLGSCLGDGAALQVSKDFTKVFCRRCGREWDRYEFEDIHGGALPIALAGAMPLTPDNSKDAKALLALLDQANIDTDSPFLVVKTEPAPEFTSIKEAWKSGWRNEPSTTPKEEVWLGLFAEYIARYEHVGEDVSVEEFDFLETS